MTCHQHYRDAGGPRRLILMPIGLDWLPLKLMGLGLDLVIVIAKWAASLGGDRRDGAYPCPGCSSADHLSHCHRHSSIKAADRGCCLRTLLLA